MNKYLDMLKSIKGTIFSEPNGWARNKSTRISPSIVRNWIDHGLVERRNGHYELTEKAKKKF